MGKILSLIFWFFLFFYMNKSFIIIKSFILTIHVNEYTLSMTFQDQKVPKNGGVDYKNYIPKWFIEPSLQLLVQELIRWACLDKRQKEPEKKVSKMLLYSPLLPFTSGASRKFEPHKGVRVKNPCSGGAGFERSGVERSGPLQLRSALPIFPYSAPGNLNWTAHKNVREWAVSEWARAYKISVFVSEREQPLTNFDLREWVSRSLTHSRLTHSSCSRLSEHWSRQLAHWFVSKYYSKI